MGDASETPAPPKKRRRRWPLVTLVLLLASLAWWHWPRRDARFVGRWRGSISHHIWHLKSNGIATLESNSPPSAATPMYHTTWASEGNLLMVGRSPYSTPRLPWHDRLLRLLRKYAPGHQILNQGVCIQLNVIEPDRLEGIDGRWPDDPTPPDVGRFKTTVWWDDFEGKTKGGGDIEYKFRKGHVPSALERLAKEQAQRPDSDEQRSKLFEKLRAINEKKASRN